MPIFGTAANSTSNFALYPCGHASMSIFGTPPMTSGIAAGPTGSFGSPAGFTNHKSSSGFGPSGTVPSRTTFGQPSNIFFDDRGLADPFTTSFGGSSTTSPGISGSVGGSTASAFGSKPQFGLFTTPIHPSQNKGSKISPYTPTRGTESRDLLQSISSMPIYGSKSHEELRFEDSELNSKGSSSTVFKQPSSNLFHSLPPSSNSTNIFNNQPPFLTELSNSILSSTTNRPFNQHSSPYPGLAPLFNSTPSSSTIPAFNFPSLAPTSSTPASSVFSGSSPSFPINSFFHSPTPSFNFTTQPSFYQNPISISIPPSTSAPSSTITWPTHSGTGNSQTNVTVAPPASTLTGNNGGLTGKIGDCVTAVKDFFGSKSSTCRPFTADPIY